MPHFQFHFSTARPLNPKSSPSSTFLPQQMATAAFKSTTKRTPIGNSTADDSAASSNRGSAHRRSRSLSRFSRPLPGAEEDFGCAPLPRGKFVNTVRGSGFPEISLDDLTVDFSDSGGGLRGRSAGRSSDAGAGNSATPASQRRGRSVSRQGSDGKVPIGNSSGWGRVVPESNSRRRRSTSVVRYQISDSESDLDIQQKHISQANSKGRDIANPKTLSSNKLTAPHHRQGLRRSFSQRDLKPHDGYASQSSTLTDDEGRDAYSSKNGIERTIRAVYSQKKAEHPTGEDVNGRFYEAMRKELRYAVEEIKMELEQVAVKTKICDSDSLQSDNSTDHQPVTTFRRNHATKLEQSEKRTQDLLAELLLEDQRGRDLSKIVKELLPDPKTNVALGKPSRSRRRSNDRNRMSKRLTEEAEKYFEDFISNVEDTDISSLDGERSDTSSVIGGIARPQIFRSPHIYKASPVGTDGVVLPWLQWETSTDASPLSCNNKPEPPASTRTVSRDAAQESTNAQDHSIYSISSRGSWSPEVVRGPSLKFIDYMSCKAGKAANCLNRSGLRLDMDDYLKPATDEEVLFERWSQRERIDSGSLILCNHMFF